IEVERKGLANDVFARSGGIDSHVYDFCSVCRIAHEAKGGCKSPDIAHQSIPVLFAPGFSYRAYGEEKIRDCVSGNAEALVTFLEQHKILGLPQRHRVALALSQTGGAGGRSHEFFYCKIGLFDAVLRHELASGNGDRIDS